MAVFVIAEHTSNQQKVLCIICFQKVPLTEVTAGSHYANGHQAFACTIHLHDRTRWILEWVKFDSYERQQKEINRLAEEA
jgi:hypothetical protein